MIRLHLPFPPSVNPLEANGGARRGGHKTKARDDWVKLASTAIKEGHRLRSGPYSLYICLEAPDKRARVSVSHFARQQWRVMTMNQLRPASVVSRWRGSRPTAFTLRRDLH
ncbi:hypothetical protein SAMN02927900_00923 [Rhizobium mongolense subsp. loessense]|uniref:Uncharacterized protein n=1 Tax=Rhizobium mongolense subsp. loessense TaxID=158890 RepID=A0A1G4PT51_9HYPH|nr:hypothetical protein SAMN02927900_00923 [Rhizobium mongolense subsp. loessense]